MWWKYDTTYDRINGFVREFYFFLTLCFRGKRSRGKGCFQVESWHIKMETSQASFQRIEPSTDTLEWETPVHQRAPADSGTQTALNLHWNSPDNPE